MPLFPEGGTLELSKWYLDCITSEGDVFIAYAARLRGLGLRLSYSSILTCRAGVVLEQTSLRGVETPRPHGAGLAWSSRPLGVRGVWTPDHAPLDPVTLSRRAADAADRGPGRLPVGGGGQHHAGRGVDGGYGPRGFGAGRPGCELRRDRAALALLVGLCMGVDFPGSDRRFSRLA